MTRTRLSRTFVHEAALYRSQEEAATLLVPFLQAGVDSGRPTFVGLPEPVRSTVLDAVGPARTRLSQLPAREDARPLTALGRTLELVERCVRGGVEEIRIVRGAPEKGLAEDWPGWARFEAALTHFCRGLPVWTVCAYDLRRTSGTALESVLATHRAVTDRAGRDADNPAFVAPAQLQRDLVEQDLDPLEDTPPDAEIADPDQATAVRAVEAAATRVGLPLPDSNALCLAVDEAVTNAWRHGQGRVSLRLWHGADRVVVTVHDQGPGPPSPFTGMVDRPGQQGMSLLYHLCTRVNTTTDSTGFTVHLVSQAGVPRRG